MPATYQGDAEGQKWWTVTTTALMFGNVARILSDRGEVGLNTGPACFPHTLHLYSTSSLYAVRASLSQHYPTSCASPELT
jgi:hypothetical protein